MALQPSQIIGTTVEFEGKTVDAEGVMTFSFKPNHVKWTGGQYMVVLLPGAAFDRRSPLRPFSVSSSFSEGVLQITTRISDQPSVFKQKMLALKPGQKVYMSGPFGSFTLRDTNSSYVFIAGGIGVTPFRAILNDCASRGVMPDITLLYATNEQTPPFADEFNALAQRYPNFKLQYIQAPQRVDADTIRANVPEYSSKQFMVSGPPAMVKGVSQLLQAELAIPVAHIGKDALKGYPWPLN